MKKMLVLILMIGITATADAAIVQLKVDGSMDGPGNDTVKIASSAIITVNSDTDMFLYQYYLAIATPGEDQGDYGTIIHFPAAGDESRDGEWIDGPDEGFIHITDIQAKDTEEPFNLVAGDHFQTTLTRTGFAVQIDLIDFDMETVLDSVTLVPEPTSAILIGVGFLFARLRRRQR